jgi:hypothetical protein
LGVSRSRITQIFLVRAELRGTGFTTAGRLGGRMIEVDNPGSLPPGLTLEDIRRGVSKL